MTLIDRGTISTFIVGDRIRGTLAVLVTIAVVSFWDHADVSRTHSAVAAEPNASKALPIVTRNRPRSKVPIPQPNPNVVGLWLLNESEGPVGEENWGIYDQSGHGNHGLRGPINTLSERPGYSTDAQDPQLWNHSLDFGTNTNARVEFADSTSLDLTGDFTVETWINFNGLSGNQYLVSKRNTNGSASGYILDWTGSSNTVQFTVGTSSGYQSVISQSFVPVVGQWYHLAGVHDATSSELRLYIDGTLNNSASAQSTVLTNDDPLVLGHHSVSNPKPLDGKLDEVRISNRVVPTNELGFSTTFGPGNLIFGDAFETYSSTGDLLSRAGGNRNHWNSGRSGPDTTFDLINTHAHSGEHSVLLQHVNAQSSNDQVSLYYNMPVAATRDEPIIAVSGWVSFTGEDNARLFFLNQVWTGSETHYGVTNTNLAGGIHYYGDEQVWKFEPPPHNGPYVTFSDPIDYTGDLDTWHYYEFTMDFDKKEYVSFQFDDDIWDLSGNPFLVLPDFFDEETVIPVVDHNVRLLLLPSPTFPYTAQFALDDAVLSVFPQNTRRHSLRVEKRLVE